MPGFSLIELLITMAIASMLMLAGTSLYSQHMVKARRLQAASTLSELAITMEEYHFSHGSYANANLKNMKEVNNHYYEFILESATDDEFVLTAAPRGAQAERDHDCGTLRLNSKGEKQFCM